MSREVIDHVTVGSAYPEYSTLKPNQKWIRCSVAEIHPFEGTELRTHAVYRVRQKKVDP